MTTEHLEAVLEDLRQKRDRLSMAIATLEEQVVLTKTAGASTAEVAASGGRAVASLGTLGTLEEHAFFGLSAVEAARKYLTLTKRVATVKEIHDGLLAGGFQTSAKNFYSNLYTAMRRAEGEVFVRVKGKWGLVDWFPSRKQRVGKKSEESGNGEENTGGESHGGADEK